LQKRPARQTVVSEVQIRKMLVGRDGPDEEDHSEDSQKQISEEEKEIQSQETKQRGNRRTLRWISKVKKKSNFLTKNLIKRLV